MARRNSRRSSALAHRRGHRRGLGELNTKKKVGIGLGVVGLGLVGAYVAASMAAKKWLSAVNLPGVNHSYWLSGNGSGSPVIPGPKDFANAIKAGSTDPSVASGVPWWTYLAGRRSAGALLSFNTYNGNITPPA